MIGPFRERSACRGAARLLTRLPDGNLSPRESAALQSHLDACPGCRREARQLRRIRELLRDEPLPDVRLPAGAELARALMAAERVRSHPARGPARAAAALALAGALSLALLVAAPFRSGTRRQPGPALEPPTSPSILVVVDDERTGRQVLLTPAAGLSMGER